MSEMLDIEVFLMSEIFWILKYIHSLFWMIIPNLNTQNIKCFEIQNLEIIVVKQLTAKHSVLPCLMWGLWLFNFNLLH